MHEDIVVEHGVLTIIRVTIIGKSYWLVGAWQVLLQLPTALVNGGAFHLGVLALAKNSG
jgi:hypothetical protein